MIPGVEPVWAGRAGTDPAEEGVALCQGTRVTPPGLGPCRPQRGAEAVEVGSSTRGRPFTSARRSGMNTARAGRREALSAPAGSPSTR